jgi:hypothetical protein
LQLSLSVIRFLTSIRSLAGQDVTRDFFGLHRFEVLAKYEKTLLIGTVEGQKSVAYETNRLAGDFSTVPYAEPLWLRPQFSSPYFNDTHRLVAKQMREWTAKYGLPEARECEATGRFISQEFIDRMAEGDMLRLRLGPGKHLHGYKFLDGKLDGSSFDYFHELAIIQEGARVDARGFLDGNLAGMGKLCYF